jgi:hypothetical protein
VLVLCGLRAPGRPARSGYRSAEYSASRAPLSKQRPGRRRCARYSRWRVGNGARRRRSGCRSRVTTCRRRARRRTRFATTGRRRSGARNARAGRLNASHLRCDPMPLHPCGDRLCANGAGHGSALRSPPSWRRVPSCSRPANPRLPAYDVDSVVGANVSWLETFANTNSRPMQRRSRPRTAPFDAACDGHPVRQDDQILRALQR